MKCSWHHQEGSHLHRVATFVKLKLYGQHYQSSDLTRSLVFSDFNSDLSRVTHFPTTSQGEQRNWVQGGLILGFLWYLVEI